jgi:hypothetical protein
MTLTPDQIKAVMKRVSESGISTQTLHDDIVDHVCCLIEEKVGQGKQFNTSVDEALNELAPEGLDEIQQQTFQLLNVKTIMMKKVTYVAGLLSTMTMGIGWILRILHRGEIGNAVFAFGCLGFVMLFLPLLGNSYFKKHSAKPLIEKSRTVLGTLSAIFVGIGTLSKIMHLPGADEVLLVAGVLFTFGFLPVYFLSLYKNSHPV